MKSMLLAAGLGTRFQPQTSVKAKPALPFLNVPMAYYSIYLLQQLGVKDFVYNTFHLPESIREVFQNPSSVHFKSWLNSFSFEESHDGKKILGNGGGLKQAESLFSHQENFILMNADEVIFPHDLLPFLNLLKAHSTSALPRLATLAVMQHPEVGQQFGGIWCDENLRVREIGKKPSRSGLKGWHYIGLQILNKEIFHLIPAKTETNIFYDVINHYLDSHYVYAHPVACSWFETGNLKSYLEATEDALKLLEKNSSKYLAQLLKTLRPQDKIHKHQSHLVYGPTGIQSWTDQATVTGFVVAPFENAPQQHHTKLDRVVFAEGAQVQNDSYKADLIL